MDGGRVKALLLVASAAMASAPVVDSRLSRKDAIGPGVPDSVSTRLDVREVRYVGFDGLEHQGQIVCERKRCRDLVDLFAALRTARFPVRSAIPLAVFHGSDSASMAADNSSCFAWRGKWGTSEPSRHAQGLALDLNPRENPAFHRGKVVPPDARLDLSAPGTLSDTSLAVRFLRSRGWRWGAHWRRVQDRQHFEAMP